MKGATTDRGFAFLAGVPQGSGHTSPVPPPPGVDLLYCSTDTRVLKGHEIIGPSALISLGPRNPDCFPPTPIGKTWERFLRRSLRPALRKIRCATLPSFDHPLCGSPPINRAVSRQCFSVMNSVIVHIFCVKSPQRSEDRRASL